MTLSRPRRFARANFFDIAAGYMAFTGLLAVGLMLMQLAVEIHSLTAIRP